MKSYATFALACVAATALAGPLELSDANFSDVLDGESGTKYFVMFYAPW